MKKLINIRSLIVLVAFLCLLIYRNHQKEEQLLPYHITGTTMGNIGYSIKYLDTKDRHFKASIDSILFDFNASLSTYIHDSEISRFNLSGRHTFQSPYMLEVLKKSKEIFDKTEGAFDPTVAPLVNAWGFGFKNGSFPSNAKIDSLVDKVGFDNISFDNSAVERNEKGSTLDFSAVAKGYAVDVLAAWLVKKGIQHYMVEIGGEVRCQGKNHEDRVWRIGIDNPISAENGIREIQASVQLNNKAIATSGNYRNYYVKDGKKYAHTISPYSGIPTENELLSVSVFSNNCMEADALATGMMVLGLEKSINIASQDNNMDIFLIYQDKQGKIMTYASEGIKEQIRY